MEGPSGNSVKALVIDSALNTMADEVARVVISQIIPKVAMNLPAFALGPLVGIASLLLAKPIYWLLVEAKISEDLNKIENLSNEISDKFVDDWAKYRLILKQVDVDPKKVEDARNAAKESFNKFASFSVS